MKQILLLLISILIIAGCRNKNDFLTTEQIEKEKDAVIKVIHSYNTAFENKDWSGVVKTLANEVIFFGTDSSEIIKTFSDYKKAIEKQWTQFEKMRYGEMSDISIHMDKYATIASIIYGLPCELTSNGRTTRIFLRVARTLKKEDDKWVIVSGIVGIVRSEGTSNLLNELEKKDTSATKQPKQ